MATIFYKKADKSLDMIFSILVLAIIAVVIIMLVLNSVNNIPKPSKYLNDSVIKTFLTKKLTQCTSLCTSASQGDEDSVVAYCTQTFAITGSNEYSKAQSFGLIDYCPNQITCPIIMRLAPQYGIRVQSSCNMESSDCQRILYELAEKYPSVLTKYESLMKEAPYGTCNLNVTNTNWMAVLLSNDINSAFTIKKPLNNKFYDSNALTTIGNNLTNHDNNIAYKNDKDSALAREAMAQYLARSGSTYKIKENLTS